MDLRRQMSFGFEETFTIPEWWTDQGFVATSDTPLKREKIRLFAEKIAQVQGGTFRESLDVFNHVQYETFDLQGRPSFVVTLDPGSVEVKTQPMLIGDMVAELKPLYEAAAQAGMVAYRQWWYGVLKGTEGQCHINIGGLTPETNPWVQRPELLVKYLIYFHNHPCLLYPFMGQDVGPGGNSKRMDEHALDPYPDPAQGALADSLEQLDRMRERILRGGLPITAEELVAHFKGTKLADVKYGAPSLYKYKAPLYLIEERGVESLRAPEEFWLVCELRMRIFELLARSTPPEVRRFDLNDLHAEGLSSWRLWLEFKALAWELGLDPAPFRVFFERQYPLLGAVKAGEPGDSAPARFRLREGRKPRKYLGVQKRNGLIISWTVDTRYGRIELEADAPAEFRVDGQAYPAREYGGVWGVQVDTFAEKPGKILDVELWEHGALAERARFSLSDMMWVSRS